MRVGHRLGVVGAGVASDDLRHPVLVAGGHVEDAARERAGVVVHPVPGQTEGGDGAVVRPDAAPVVRQRVVRLLSGREGPDAPAGEELGGQQPLGHRLAVLLREDARPQQVARVRAERVRAAAVAVQRQRREVVLAQPEVGHEALPQPVGGVLQPVRVRRVAPRRAGEAGGAAQRVVGIALDGGGPDDALGRGAVGEADRAGRVLPALVRQTAGVRPVQQVAVLAQPAVLEHPVHGGPRVALEAVGELVVGGGLGVRAEQHQEEGSAVDGPEVPPVGDLPEVRQLAVAQLVHDLAGLRDPVGVLGLGLGGGQGQQCRGGRLGVAGQREQGGDQRVPAQQRQEPRHARGRHPQRLAVGAGGRDPQPGQVGGALRAGAGQLRPAVRNLGLQGGAGREDVGGLGGVRLGGAVGVGLDAQRQLGGAVRRQVEEPAQAAGATAGLLHRVGRGPGGDDGPRGPLAPPVPELDAVGQRGAGPHRVRLVVPAVVPAQLELVGEVGVHREGDQGA